MSNPTACMKSWTYQEITETIEQEILSLQDHAVKSSREDAMIILSWAYGVYLGWHSLTSPRRDEGDDARLRALARRNYDMLIAERRSAKGGAA